MVTIGQTFSHFRILEKLGDGGMSVVYRARDETLDRDVALKVLREDALVDAAARGRLRKEARALSKLNHPNIEFLFEFNREGTDEFLAVEFVPGSSLNDRLRQEAFSEKEIVRLGMQLADGLTTAHAHGVVHCDLKPSNLRITPEGRLKIIDFGIAKLLRPIDESRKKDGTTWSSSGNPAILGTLPYMAPEQLRNESTDGRTDIYGAGVVLYEAATGCRPFQDEATPALIDNILHQPPVPPRAVKSKISVELERIILKCLQKEPENRYQSARELEVDLRQLAVPSTATAPVARWRAAWRGRAKMAVIALAVVAALTVGLMGSGWWKYLLERGNVRRIESLAVLPLEDLSGNDYFADGMTDELITHLAQIKALRVISRTSVMRYKGSTKSLQEIAKELNVDALVEGSVLRSGNRVRITSQLIQAATDQNVWAESYERDLRDVLKLQSEVARAIAQEIQIKLSPQEESRLLGERPVKTEAYEAYLKGRYFWNKRDRASVMEGLKNFQHAIELDPTYALAYVGVADSYILLGGTHQVSSRESLPQAKAAAEKALEIDPAAAEAHASLALLKQLEWDWAGAASEYGKCLALNSGYASAHQWYSLLLAETGHSEEAIVEAQRASELDPLSPIITMNLGQVLYVARRYAAARQALERTLAVSPDFLPARCFLAQIDLQTGKSAESVAELEKAAKLSPEDDTIRATLGYAYALSGRRSEAQAVLTYLRGRSRKRYVSPYLMAAVYGELGERGEAFNWLEEAYRQRDGELPWVGVEPLLDPLRSDPRFKAFVSRMNFPKQE